MHADAEIDEMTALAVAAQLDGREKLLDRARVRLHCNGIGAAWMPKIARDILNKFAPELVVTSWIHDLDYETGGVEADRVAADDRMYRNGLVIAHHLYGWYNPRRYRVRRRALEFRAALAIAGKSAFNYTTDREK